MKIMHRFLAFSLLTLSLWLTHGYAQDYITWGLPEGAKARFGKGRINALSLSPDGTRLAVASTTGIWLYDTDTGAELALLTGHIDAVESVSFSADGSLLVSGSYGEIFLWHLETRRILKTLKGHKGRVGNLGILEDRGNAAQHEFRWHGSVLGDNLRSPIENLQSCASRSQGISVPRFRETWCNNRLDVYPGSAAFRHWVSRWDS